MPAEDTSPKILIVEDKQDTEKRTGQPSPNIGDSIIITIAPKEVDLLAALLKSNKS